MLTGFFFLMNALFSLVKQLQYTVCVLANVGSQKRGGIFNSCMVLVLKLMWY